MFVSTHSSCTEIRVAWRGNTLVIFEYMHSSCVLLAEVHVPMYIM
eukprot:COSAG02_NODE_5299_length_4460_cov_2.430864_3_plen_45_part_00